MNVINYKNEKLIIIYLFTYFIANKNIINSNISIFKDLVMKQL